MGVGGWREERCSWRAAGDWGSGLTPNAALRLRHPLARGLSFFAGYGCAGLAAAASAGRGENI